MRSYTCIYKGPVCHPPSATCPHVAVLVEGADSASSVTREKFHADADVLAVEVLNSPPGSGVLSWFFSWLGLETMARGASGAMALSMQFLAQSRPAQVLVACVELQPRAATCRVRPWGVQEINWAQGRHSRMEAARQAADPGQNH